MGREIGTKLRYFVFICSITYKFSIKDFSSMNVLPSELDEVVELHQIQRTSLSFAWRNEHGSP